MLLLFPTDDVIDLTCNFHADIMPSHAIFSVNQSNLKAFIQRNEQTIDPGPNSDVCGWMVVGEAIGLGWVDMQRKFSMPSGVLVSDLNP